MLIRAYGLFWEKDEIDWNPGSGNKKAFRLLGRVGKNAGSIRMADFRKQSGIYILYNNHGPYYVGLTNNRLGSRLKAHLTDIHEGKWTRFSWFGFHSVLKSTDEDGLRLLKPMKLTLGDPQKAIADVEALLIHAMGTRNTNKMKFKRAECWEQVKRVEVEGFLAKVKPS